MTHSLKARLFETPLAFGGYKLYCMILNSPGDDSLLTPLFQLHQSMAMVICTCTAYAVKFVTNQTMHYTVMSSWFGRSNLIGHVREETILFLTWIATFPQQRLMIVVFSNGNWLLTFSINCCCWRLFLIFFLPRKELNVALSGEVIFALLLFFLCILAEKRFAVASALEMRMVDWLIYDNIMTSAIIMLHKISLCWMFLPAMIACFVKHLGLSWQACHER